MNSSKRAALEAAGFRVGDAADFLGLSAAESRLIDLRVALGRAIRDLRETHQLTQQQLATRIASSQSRVAKIEKAAPDVSLDLMFRGFFAVGGDLAGLAPAGPRPTRPRKRSTKGHA